MVVLHSGEGLAILRLLPTIRSRALSLNPEADLPSTRWAFIQQEDGNIPIGQVCPA
jgi:hypothetical protein